MKYEIAPGVDPLGENAAQIMGILKTSVTEKLSGVFPKNSVYQCGNYNLVYVVAESLGKDRYGFCADAKMIVLNPAGEIRSGIVHQDVGSWTSYWEFRQADLQRASDEDVIRYSPQLVSNLLSQLEVETHEEKSPQKIYQIMSFLAENPYFYSQIAGISSRALQQLGEHDPQLVHNIKVDPYNDEFLQSLVPRFEEQRPEYKVERVPEKKINIKQKREAIELYICKDDMITTMSEIAGEMNPLEVAETFKEIVGNMSNKGIFPANTIGDDGVTWFHEYKTKLRVSWGPEVSRIKKLSSRDEHRMRNWYISDKGKVVEVDEHEEEKIPTVCSEHLVAQAPEIVSFLIEGAAKQYFPWITEAEDSS